MTDRPIIPIPKTKLEWLLDGLSLLALAVPTIYLFMIWGDLPAEVPIHFNAAGEADGWGGKGTSLILPIIGLLLFVGLSLLRKIPHHFNYPVTLTTENAEKKYRLSIQMLSWLKFEISLLFGFILWNLVRTAQDHAESMGWLMPVALAAILGTTISYTVRIAKK
ncbi:DUF1648 domain-containing protein [Paenibacillus sp. 1011MAR3C5]|uniref:DUF1648 domain-containing protein n=1 Tax=Paenibacillus sp. 1011MAR3C5 TaxID=1675787 RepID=UPI000E6C53C5|nr:DUF1648 domain-containing protein [Paenibacillus sp. 1011MAR3C5]RJE88544.1 DUF1648 domain-containing protein [Paenibacillus sp. 1011MAR3C5]